MEKSKSTIFLYVAEINKPGGTERVVVNLANNFHQHGYEVKIMSVNTKSGESYYELDKGVHLFHLGVVLEPNVLKRVTVGYYNTVKAIRRSFPDESAILLATDPITSYAFGILATKFLQHKFVVCEHMGLAIAKKYSLLARQLLFGKVDAVVTLTQTDCHVVQQLNSSIKCCVCIPNEVSFYPTESCDYSARQILAVGKYDLQKGFDWLLPTIAPVLKKHTDWKLKLVGQGEFQKSLESFVQKENLSKQVELAPPTKQIQKAYLGASIYVMSSRFEGFPMVLLEARACGLPVLSVDCPSGPADILHVDDGILVPMNDGTQFNEALEKLIQSEEMRQTLGAKAKEDTKNYNREAIFQHWQSLFQRL